MKQRTIKFRAWDGKGMREVRSLHNIHSQVNIHADLCHNKNDPYPPAVIEAVYDLVLMQYTGLKDKNGKEIYEGDIVESTILGKKFRGEVHWETMCYRVKEDDLDVTLGHDKEATRKVIGNIYENPDLIHKVD